LTLLVVFQTVAGLFSCLLLGWILRRSFGVRRWLIALAACFAALEPLQLLLERFVMTEAMALLALAISLGLLFEYLRTVRLGWLLGFQLAGTVLISLRISWLPFVLLAALVAPAAAMQPRESRSAGSRRLFRHWAVSLLSLTLLHGGYCLFNAWLSGRPPAYIHSDGLVQLAALSPLVRPQDGPNDSVREVIAQTENQGIERRILQLHSAQGLIPRLRERIEDPIALNRLAKQTAYNAAWRDPLGVLMLGWRTYAGYWRGDFSDPLLSENLDYPGFREILKRRFHLQADDRDLTRSWVRSWYQQARPWYRVILLSPLLAAALFVLQSSQRLPSAFLFLALATILAVVCLLSTNWSYRHLHQAAWLALLILPLLADSLLNWISRDPHQPS